MKPNPLAAIKPINEKVAYHMIKDLAMADIATQFIGKSCAALDKPRKARFNLLALASTRLTPK